MHASKVEMDLILWRHADAGLAGEGPGDLVRPLSKKGLRQAQQMGEWLQRHLPDSTRALVSPAVRTRQTADALGRPYLVTSEVGVGASVESLLAAAGWPDASEPVLVVGHQPTLGSTAARLLADGSMDWSVRKGAVWWLRRRVRETGTEVVLKAVLSADLL